MKLSPPKKTKKLNYPNLNDYKKKTLVTTFTIGMALIAPSTSCVRTAGTPKPIKQIENKEEVEIPSDIRGRFPNPNKKKKEEKKDSKDDGKTSSSKKTGAQNIEPIQKDDDKTSSSKNELKWRKK
jgi:hypothetical protein